VTGETAESVWEAIVKFAKSFEFPPIEDLDSLCAALERIADTALPDHPSARCAVEIALFDLGARHLDLTAVEAVQALARRLDLPLRDPAQPVVHSGVVGEGSLGKTIQRGLKMRLFGLREIKVKVGSDLALDVRKLRWLRRILGPDTDVRVDANGAWSFPDAVAAIGAFTTFGITSVEQPLAKGDEERLPDLRRAVQVPIALDESLTSLADARRAIERGECDLFNIRLSKCGGFVSSLRILAEAKRAGLGAWLGCMVGESPLLSAAGRAFALSVAGLRHLEGAYDRHLFAEHLADPPLSFRRGGLGDALEGTGLGVQLDGATLNRWTKQWDHFRLR
jgi:muconate cycloisomerase